MKKGEMPGMTLIAYLLLIIAIIVFGILFLNRIKEAII